MTDGGEYRHVIITSEALAPYLEPLREWRTKHGFPSRVVTVAEIVSQHPGFDDAEKVRNFIKHASANWGALYFTLAGDLGVVPVRNCSQADTLGHSYMPVDLYFSDLDGTWDPNNNHIYGEPVEVDSIDLYCDVFVGRASIETPGEATTFVSKTLTYEKTPAAGYIENCLLPAVQLWPNYQGDIVNDSIAACTAHPWNDIKMYQTLGNITRPAVSTAINDGLGFCHYAAHGNENGVYFANSDTVQHSTDALALSNGDRLGIHNSIACISGGFDIGDVADDCFAEHLMNNPNGGAVAVIMNSRVGLGTPPDMGPSEMLSLEFYRKVFREGVFRIGMAHGLSKDVYVPIGIWYYDFCIAELNLFGDAALAMWTAEPAAQVVTHPDWLPHGPCDFTVTVTSGTSIPLDGALVCILSTSGEVYDYGYTNTSGEITFSIAPTGDDTLQVTSTAPDYLPYEGQAYVDVATGVTGGGDTPTFFAMSPNPVTDGATFRFGLEDRGPVEVRIFDVAGRRVSTLRAGPYGPGVHELRWDGKTLDGGPLASGVYFVKFIGGGRSFTRKLVVVR
jgi:hypothetical protein